MSKFRVFSRRRGLRPIKSPERQRQVNLRTGVCFSGGGSRALTVTMGVLRALESLKLIPHIDAISSVSGGTWASSIYMFAKDVSIKDATLQTAFGCRDSDA